MECDGAVLSVVTYPALTALLGTTFGTYGKLPDLRGEFIRGWVHNRTGTTDDGRILGSWQEDLFRAHSHQEGSSGGGAGIGVSSHPTAALNYFGVSYTADTGGIETRPRNLTLLPCIKY